MYYFDHVAGLALAQVLLEQQVEVGDHRVERSTELPGSNSRALLETLHPESNRHFPSHL